MTFLLDVNVLIALVDDDHVHHDAAHRWFETEGWQSWATCPLTENGVLRIVGDPRYPNSPGSPIVVAPLVKQLQIAPGHAFWADDISLLNLADLDHRCLLHSRYITDTYLLALAKSRNGTLTTFDRHLVTSAVKNGRRHLRLLS
ncbi:TA system VapC family ribonuclease toxin [Massilia sp. SR12]